MTKFVKDVLDLERQLQVFTEEEFELSDINDLDVIIYRMRRRHVANGIRRKLLKLYRYIGKPKMIAKYNNS